MKIAYIIQCHKNPQQINRLTTTLINNDYADVDIYIHIDKNNNHIRNDINVNENIFLLTYEESVAVYWAGISQVEATLKLIENLLQSNKEYDYIWFISGQDFPIKSNKKIVDFLSKNNNKAYIEVADDNCEINYDKRCDLFYPKWMIDRTLPVRILRRIYRELTGGTRNTFKIFKRKSPVEKFYFGSCWWCLPIECVKEIYQIHMNNPKIIKFLENSICPDECYFQTLVMQSSFKNSVEMMLTYVDWTNCNGSPRTLNTSDFDKLINSNFLLARKFDNDIDSNITNKLTEYIKE